MHISEGVLDGPVLAAGGVVAASGVAIGLAAIDDRALVKVSVLASAFFVASLIRVPVGVASVHLILNGLAGLLLGWAAFPAFAVALLLQAVLFGYGGLTTLGVNIVIMAAPAVACYYLFRRLMQSNNSRYVFIGGLAAGATSIALGAILLATFLVTSGREFLPIALTQLAAHIPIMITEGMVTAFAVTFLRQVRPETFHYRTPNTLPEKEAA